MVLNHHMYVICITIELFDILNICMSYAHNISNIYLYQKSKKYYLLPDEDDPHWTCKNKNYVSMAHIRVCCCSGKVWMEIAFFMEGFIVFHFFDMNQLWEVMRELAVFMETWLWSP
jgi:hypothetical protein